MANCPKCGTELNDSVKFCTSCGEKIQTESPNAEAKTSEQKKADMSAAAADIGDTLKKLNDTKDATGEFDAEDIDKNKIMGILAYLSWLVLNPIIAAPKSKFARYHANQGLILAIVGVSWGIVQTILSAVIGGIFGLIGLGAIAAIIISLLGLVNLVLFIFAVIGIVNVVNGKAKELPIIGQSTLIKYN